jgi:hypothetical protein
MRTKSAKAREVATVVWSEPSQPVYFSMKRESLGARGEGESGGGEGG